MGRFTPGMSSANPNRIARLPRTAIIHAFRASASIVMGVSLYWTSVRRSHGPHRPAPRPPLAAASPGPRIDTAWCLWLIASRPGRTWLHRTCQTDSPKICALAGRASFDRAASAPHAQAHRPHGRFDGGAKSTLLLVIRQAWPMQPSKKHLDDPRGSGDESEEAHCLSD